MNNMGRSKARWIKNYNKKLGIGGKMERIEKRGNESREMRMLK